MKIFCLFCWMILMISGCATNGKTQAVRRLDSKIVWIGEKEPAFPHQLSAAEEALQKFAQPYGWDHVLNPAFVAEIRHFSTKVEFDLDLKKASPDQSQPIPKTFVAVMDNRLLRTISWQAYQKIHPSDVEADYIKLLQHEMAHQLHTDLVGDDQMGPTWFYEGFAVVAAGQYVSAAPLSEHEIRRIICSKDRGDYREYGSVLRILMERHSLPELVEWARQADFMGKLGFSSCS